MVTTAPFCAWISAGYKNVTHNANRTSGADFASMLPPFFSQKDSLRLVRSQSHYMQLAEYPWLKYQKISVYQSNHIACYVSVENKPFVPILLITEKVIRF